MSKELMTWHQWKANPTPENRRKFLEDNIGLLKKVCQRFMKGNAFSPTEILQFGYEGLDRAADLYNPGRGVPWAPYAARSIYGWVLNNIRKHKDRERQQCKVKQNAFRELQQEISGKRLHQQGLTNLQQDDIYRMLEEALTDRELKVIWLRFFGGLSLGDIAKELSISKSNAKEASYKALAKLRVALAGRESEFLPIAG